MKLKTVLRHLRYGWGPEPPEWAHGVTGMLATLVIVLLVIFVVVQISEGVQDATQTQTNVQQSTSGQE